ncbi:DEAD/DEAH box helicase [Cereibacter sphaeroides]|uniref:DEAD/DEAH box helicase n=1 Tax=Cereibacter sphaeroides TaxID=1063 RepID=UPI001F33F1FB|nr:DEAD/DEAH box helicase [Cereibacter sphaeroides]MCE6961151.1 DEAD/DEAH box helicase [Cereibacter sphaeroides]MCE6970137.1 DEAD/DEAH box helicase [Cereibacter sphaeroides]MCE6974124.1 DEAD/DEAH box helicase [Cereibacter sphaeroides]
MFDLISQSNPAPQPKELRPHQVRAVEMIRASLAKGNRRVVCQGPTGFGKTLTAAKIIDAALAKQKKVIFTAPAISLIDQTVEAFENEGIRDIGVMQANHPRTDRLAKLQVASVQTLARREIPDAALILVDECHLGFHVIHRLMDERPDVFFIGLSATPWAKAMGLRWQDLVIPVTIGELIEGGWLSQFVVYAPDVPDLRGLKVQAGDFAEAQLADVMGDAKLVGNVAQTWLAKGEDRPTLCFAVNRAHAAQLQAQFERQGVAAAYVDGETDAVERQRLNRLFREGCIKVICSVRTMITGVDLPVSCIIDAAPTKSEMLHVQKIGRGLRVNPGTEDCLILDPAGNSLRLGLVTDIHHDRLDATEKGAKQERKPKAEKLPKPCSQCGVLHAGKVCPGCGHERRPVANVEAKDGELVEVTGKKRSPTMAEKQRFWSMALWMDRDRGWRPGRARNLYRDRYGVWPRGLSDVPMFPDQAFFSFEKSRRIAYAKRKAAVRAEVARQDPRSSSPAALIRQVPEVNGGRSGGS